MKKLKRFAVFASGRGTNLENIIWQVRSGKIPAGLGLVFSDNPGAPALKKAKRSGIKTLCLIPQDFSSKEEFEREVLKNLRGQEIDFIVLAGYMRIVGSVLIGAFPSRILNIHPALLPAFKGAQAIRDAYDYGAKVTGVTVHFVDAQVDHGPIILQKAVPLKSGDSLADVERKIHRAEYELYPEAIRLLLQGRLKMRGRKVVILKR